MTLQVGYKTTMIRRSMSGGGFRETRGGQFNAYWGMAPPRSAYRKLKIYQRINHFPGTFALGRKDRLVRGVQRMRRRLMGAVAGPDATRLGHSVR